MELLFVCIKIFCARILDVTIATFRQNILLKGRCVLGSVLAFAEIKRSPYDSDSKFVDSNILFFGFCNGDFDWKFIIQTFY